MNKKFLKKSLSVLMAATMMLCMTGCGDKSGESTKKEEEKVDSKNYVFEGNEMSIEGIEGEVSEFKIQGGKLFLTTYEWMSDEEAAAFEGESAEGEDTASEEEVAEGEDTASEEEVAEGEDTASEEESAEGEDTASEEESAEGEDTASEEEVAEGEDTASEEEVAEGEDTASEEESAEGEESSDEEIESEEEEIDYETTQRFYIANVDGSDLKEIPYKTQSGKDYEEYVNNILINQNGDIAFMLGSYDNKSDKMQYSIVKINENGEELERIDITKDLNLGEEDYISSVVMDDKGRIAIIMDSCVKILDENAKYLGEVKADGWLMGAARTKDGQIICAVSGDENCTFNVLDIDGKKWGETYKLEVSYLTGSGSLMDGNDYDVYYAMDDGIYGYTLADQKSEKILDYVASNLDSSSSYGIVPVSKDELMGITYDETSKLIKYTKVDPSTIEDKKVITVGAMYVDDVIKQAAINFNKENSDYKVEFKDYSNEEDPETKMNADIVAGNIPDILMLSGLPIEQYAAKGILEDLEPYFEKDSELNTSDMVQSVYEAMKIDGKLYYVAPGFSISTLIGKTEDVGSEMGWTYDDMKAALEKKGDQASLFYSDSKTSIMYAVLYQGLSDFVNWQTGECSFDSQDFKDILEICNSGTDEEEEYNEDSPSLPTLIRENKVLLSEGWITLEELQVNKKMFDGDITCVGYPNSEKSGSYFQFETQAGIYSKSENKDGAWEFIRTLMTKEYQGNNNMMWSTPTRQDCFDMMIKAKTTTETYKDEFGNEINPVDSTYGYEDLEIKIGPASQEDVDMYIELINNTKKVDGYNSAIMMIIEEEVKSYFAGEKSVDETADIIQNRVTTYVNENR